MKNGSLMVHIFQTMKPWEVTSALKQVTWKAIEICKGYPIFNFDGNFEIRAVAKT
jgi:hypothetical protein